MLRYEANQPTLQECRVLGYKGIRKLGIVILCVSAVSFFVLSFFSPSVVYADTWSQTTFPQGTGVFTNTKPANANADVVLDITKISTAISGDSDILSSNNMRHIVRDSSNVLHMVWESAGYMYYSSSSDEGATWAAATTIYNTAANAGAANVIIDASNNIHAFCNTYDPDNYRTYHNKKAAGGGWGGVVTVCAGHASSDESASYVPAVIDSGGTINFVYDQSHLRGTGIKTYGGAWSGVTDLNAVGDHAYQSTQAIGTNLYHVYRLSNGYMYFMKREAAVWSATAQLSTFSVDRASTIVDKDSNFWVFVRDETNGGIKSNKYTVGSASWSGWSTVTDGAVYYPSATRDSAGNIWLFYNSGSEIFYKKRDYVLGTWGNAVQVTTNAADGACYYPRAKYQNYNNNQPDKIELVCRQGSNPYYLYYISVSSPTGVYISEPITPTEVSYWGVLTYTKTTPTNTNLTVDVLKSSDNSLLVANVPSGTDLKATYPGTFTNITGIKLRGNFSTSDTSQTPTLSDWLLEYSTKTTVTTSNWTSLAKKDRRVIQGQDIGWVSFQMKTDSGQARLRRMRIDQVTSGVTTPVAEGQAEVSLWMETNNNGSCDSGDTMISNRVKFTNGSAMLTINNHIVDTTLRTYYIRAKILDTAGGGTKLKLRVADGSWLEFQDATCIGVPQ